MRITEFTPDSSERNAHHRVVGIRHSPYIEKNSEGSNGGGESPPSRRLRRRFLRLRGDFGRPFVVVSVVFVRLSLPADPMLLLLLLLLLPISFPRSALSPTTARSRRSRPRPMAPFLRPTTRPRSIPPPSPNTTPRSIPRDSFLYYGVQRRGGRVRGRRR